MLCNVINSITVLCVFTRADDACVKYREVLLAGGEGGDGEGAKGLGTAAHPPLRRRTGTLYSWKNRRKKLVFRPFLYSKLFDILGSYSLQYFEGNKEIYLKIKS